MRAQRILLFNVYSLYGVGVIFLALCCMLFSRLYVSIALSVLGRLAPALICSSLIIPAAAWALQFTQQQLQKAKASSFLRCIGKKVRHHRGVQVLHSTRKVEFEASNIPLCLCRYLQHRKNTLCRNKRRQVGWAAWATWVGGKGKYLLKNL